MSVFNGMDEDTIRQEMDAFLNRKLRKSPMIKRLISAKNISESVDEFIDEMKEKYLNSSSKVIKGERDVQSDSCGEQKLQRFQTVIRSVRCLFEKYKGRYTDSIRRS